MSELGKSATQVLHIFLHFQNQLRLYHWNTKLYPRHVASGELYGKMDSFLDQFVEIYMGKFKGGILSGKPFKYNIIKLELENLNDSEIINLLNDFKHF
jgi:hypothetical protein